MYEKDFPFDMVDLAYLLKLEVKHKTGASWNVNCPFCQDRKGKMNLNLKKKVFRCNRCGESGGMLDLYGKLYNVDYAAANEEIMEALGKGSEKSDYIVQKKELDKKLPEVEQAETATVKERNRTYTMLLRFLPLAVSHEANLLERGFSRRRIYANGYKSTPAYGFKKLAERLLKEGCRVEGIPGFYLDKDERWTVNFSAKDAGFLVPVRNMDGLIEGMQIRLDHPYDGRKYIWFSSANRRMGVTSKSPVHFVGEEEQECVFVTEGPLKADLANFLSGRTFAAVAGVNLYGNLPPVMKQLKQQGTRLVYEAYDMDKLLKLICQNDYKEEYCSECKIREEGIGKAICPKKEIKRSNIQKGCKNLYRICKECGLESKSLTWDTDEKGEWNGNIKGVDDYLFDLKGKKQ